MKKLPRTTTILTGVALIGLSAIPAEAQQKLKTYNCPLADFQFVCRNFRTIQQF